MGRFRRPLALALILATAAAAAAWWILGSPTISAAGFRNLLLVTLDTTRADRLGCYGYAGAGTPNLDRLAANGVVFERCVTVAPYTMPAHASILTGLIPPRHGVRVNGAHALPDEVDTLAESLSAAGFDTGAVVSALVLDSRFGLSQGFDRYDDDLSAGADPGLLQFRETPGHDTVRRALNWLEARGEERFFLWAHFFDPHDPYEPPEPFAEPFRGDPYQGEIAYTDHCVGQLVDWLEQNGRLENTLVLVVADHGESLGEHGESTHGHFVYLPTTRVPMILHHPALAAGTRVAPFVSTVDLVPTLLELLRVPGPEVHDGSSLAGAVLEGRSSGLDRPVYSEAMLAFQKPSWANLHALRRGELSYIETRRPELYDLESDPGEERNRIDTDPRTQEMSAALAEVRGEGDVGVHLGAPGPLDADTSLALAELGYVTESRDHQAISGGSLDPKDVLEWSEAEQAALRNLRAGDLEGAHALLEGILEQHPRDATSASFLLGIYWKADRWEEAERLLERFFGTPGEYLEPALSMVRREAGRDDWQRVDGGSRNNLAVAMLFEDAGEIVVCARLFNSVGSRRENPVTAMLGSSRALARQDQFAAAGDLLRETLLRAPHDPQVLMHLAWFQRSRGKWNEVERWARDAQRRDPRDPQAPLLRAEAAAERGDAAGANAALEEALSTPVLVPARERPEIFLMLEPGIGRSALVEILEVLRAEQRLLAAWQAAEARCRASGWAELASRIAARREALLAAVEGR